MSFSTGFEKTAGLGKMVGQLGGTISKGTKGAVKAVGDYATGQRVDRVKGFLNTTGKTEAQQLARKSAISGQEVQKAHEGLKASAEANGGLTSMSQKQQAANQARQSTQARIDKVEQRSAENPAEKLKKLDTQKEISKKNSMSFTQKHPYVTAGAALLGAKALLGGNSESKQQQPPQVVQY